METATTQLILSRLDEIGRKVDANTEATNGVVTANAVLTERVNNLIDKTEDHIESDKTVHETQGKKIEGLDKWRTELKTKIATYAAAGAGFIAVVWEVGKEAIARVFP